MINVEKLRLEFPILSRQVNGKPLVYLDNGASSQKPKVVIDAISNSYSNEYSNVHRGLHYLSNLATDNYERVRSIIQKFLSAEHEDEIVFTSGTTEGINLAAYAWAMQHLSKDDEIILSVMEHHANIVPWHFLRERLGVRLKWVDCDSNGNLDPQRIIDQFTENTKLLAITHMSNVLGTVVDVRTLCHEARTKGIVSLVDGSQAAVHMPVNVSDIGCDFYAITGHKLCGPSGSGALYVRNEMQKTMRPFLGGGDMIKDVFKEKVIYNDPPMKFEAGTPGIVQTIGLGVALEYMMNIGMDNIKAYENDLTSYARQRLEGLNWLNIQGKPDKKGAIFAFTLEGSAHAHDISTILDKQGIAVRAGQHCAGPLMHHMGINASCRASFAFYNTRQEVDKLLSGLELARDLLS
jgi:cysteine desulfurase/selenocysteine lyase